MSLSTLIVSSALMFLLLRILFTQQFSHPFTAIIGYLLIILLISLFDSAAVEGIQMCIMLADSFCASYTATLLTRPLALIPVHAARATFSFFSLIIMVLPYFFVILNDEKIPTPAQYSNLKLPKHKGPYTGKWSSERVTWMLKNEVYIGNLVQGKQTSLGYKVHKKKKVDKKDWCRIENTHEAIIDRETFDKAQQLREKRQRISPIKEKR